MKKIVFFSLLITLTTQAFAQKKDSAICVKFNKEKALKELHNKTPKLVIVGGIVRAEKPGDKQFAKKYHIQFIDTGCVIEDTECIAAYNKIAINYLDKKYGKKWRKQVRQDLIGL